VTGNRVTRCYAWPITVRAGDELNLHVSTEHPRFAVRLFRFGASVEEVPGQDAVYDGYDLPIGRPDEAWGWPRYSIALGEDLRDGIYVAVPHTPGISLAPLLAQAVSAAAVEGRLPEAVIPWDAGRMRPAAVPGARKESPKGP